MCPTKTEKLQSQELVWNYPGYHSNLIYFISQFSDVNKSLDDLTKHNVDIAFWFDFIAQPGLTVSVFPNIYNLGLIS